MAAPARTSTDASRLTFPLQLVVVLIGTVIAAAGTVWTIEAGLRSDVRNLSTQMENSARLAEVQRELDRERLERAAEKQQSQNDALKVTVESLEKAQQLMKVEFQQFKESMLTIQGLQGVQGRR